LPVDKDWNGDHALRRTTKKTVDPINWNDGTGSVVLNAAGLDDPWSYQYDVFGNLSRVTDPLSHYTTYDHDALDRFTRTTLHNGADTVLEYDNLGNLKKVTDPVGSATSYTSDYLHRRRSEQTSFGTESYLCDLAGNLIWKKDRLDQITRYDFDKLARVVQERWKNAAGTTIRTMPFTYDNLGRLVGAADATSGAAASYGFVYDALGRVTQATHALGGMTSSVVVDQAFDAGGNRTQLKAKVGAANDFANNYAFDALNRVTQITQQSQTGGNAVAAKRIDLAYDKAGRLTDMKYDGGGITTIDYDVRYNEHLLDYVTITAASAVTIDFGYDTVDQVNSLDYTGTGMPADVNYSYDDAGNRTNTGYSTGAMNRLASDGVYNYQYDARGNRTLRTKISDNTKTEYAWDHRNRLTGVKFKSAGGTVTKEVQYSYDAFNRLVRRRLDADGAGAGGFTDTFWVYDGEEAILEFASGAATAPSHRYLWGPAVDQILANEQVATGSPADVRWPMTDWQGTVRDVATYDASTNVTTIANHKVYEAFGKVHSESGPTVDTIFGFTGRYFDDDTGLQWNLNRWYDPGVGRWLSEDPIGFAAGDPNLYRYVGNSPGDSVDPSGLDGKKQPLGAGAIKYDNRPTYRDYPYDRPAHLFLWDIVDLGYIELRSWLFGEDAAKAHRDRVQEKIAWWEAREQYRQSPTAPIGGTNPAIGMIGPPKNPKSLADAATRNAARLQQLRSKYGDPCARGMAGECGAVQAVDRVKNGATAATHSIGGGSANPAVQRAASRGSTLHSDKPGHLPDQLRQRYPETEFEFAKPGVIGQDVKVIGGTHPSEYAGSTWPEGVYHADFKPNSPSGKYTFRADQKKKWTEPTQMLPYDPTTGTLE
jgi:RHS repeat-associated protein